MNSGADHRASVAQPDPPLAAGRDSVRAWPTGLGRARVSLRDLGLAVRQHDGAAQWH